MRTSTSRQANEAHAGNLFGAAIDIAGASATLVANLLEHVERLVGDVTDDAVDVARQCTGLWEVASERVTEVARAVRATPRFARVAGELLSIVAAYRWHEAVARTRMEWLGADAEGLDRCTRAAPSASTGSVSSCAAASSSSGSSPRVASTSCRPPMSRPCRACRTAFHRCRGPPSPNASPPSSAPRPTPSSSVLIPSRSRRRRWRRCMPPSSATARSVVVKVQVPDIETVVEADLAALRTVAPALRELVPFLDVETLATELSRAVLAELDYEAEAGHAETFARCFAADSDVVVPDVYRACSSRRVLVLQHLTGERLIDYLDACEQRGDAGAHDRDRVFEILIRSFCAQVLEYGLLHADPHPGNFLVLPGPDGPRLALLDFGCVQRYPAARRRAYAELCIAVLSGDAARMAALFESIGFHTRDGGAAALRAFADLLLEAFRSDASFATQEIDARAAVARVLELTRDNPIVAVPGDFILLGRVFAVLGGLLMRYRPRVNLFQLLVPQLARAAQPSDAP
jgi:hypothetical protein